MKNRILLIAFALGLARKTWQKDEAGRRVYGLRFGIRHAPEPRKQIPAVDKNQLPLPIESIEAAEIRELRAEVDRARRWIQQDRGVWNPALGCIPVFREVILDRNGEDADDRGGS